MVLNYSPVVIVDNWMKWIRLKPHCLNTKNGDKLVEYDGLKYLVKEYKWGSSVLCWKKTRWDTHTWVGVREGERTKVIRKLANAGEQNE